MNITDILSTVCVLNRDNGKRFTVTDRLDAITELLWDTPYKRINADGLFHLYAKKPLTYFRAHPAIVVSSHVDCVTNFTECFSKAVDDRIILGTYDNALTNAAVLSLMLSDCLPDNVMIAFTGDEEVTSAGATDTAAFLKKHQLWTKQIFVLDVTDMGWYEEADFTIENDFWDNDDGYGEKIIRKAESLPYRWRFVPEDIDNIPGYVKSEYLIHMESAEDESWDYDEFGINCCSICIPIHGDMHSSSGVLARIDSLLNYADALRELLHI